MLFRSECNGTTIFSDGSGGWPDEISWTISNCEGEVITEGVIPTDQCVELPETYTIEMYDSWGDGWNGNIWSLYDQNGNLAASCTLDTGTQAFCDINLR